MMCEIKTIRDYEYLKLMARVCVFTEKSLTCVSRGKNTTVMPNIATNFWRIDFISFHFRRRKEWMDAMTIFQNFVVCEKPFRCFSNCAFCSLCRELSFPFETFLAIVEEICTLRSCFFFIYLVTFQIFVQKNDEKLKTNITKRNTQMDCNARVYFYLFICIRFFDVLLCWHWHQISYLIECSLIGWINEKWSYFVDHIQLTFLHAHTHTLFTSEYDITQCAIRIPFYRFLSWLAIKSQTV